MDLNNQTLVFKLNFDNQDVFNDKLDKNKQIFRNFIADLRDVDSSVLEDIKEKLCSFGEQVYINKGSFIIVSTISFDERLNIVPTLQEAYDFIEMEEIERQLDV